MLLRMMLSIGLVMLSLCSPALGKTDSQAVKVALLPLDMSKAGRYDFLGDALHNMLASRLSGAEDVEIVDISLSKKEYERLQGLVKLEDAENSLKKMNTDYVGAGATYATQGGLKLQMTFYPKDSAKKPIALTMVAKDEGEIIAAVGNFAEEIREKALGLKVESKTVTIRDGETDGLAAFQTEHPEKAYKKGVYSGGLFGDEDGGSVISSGAESTITIKEIIVGMDRGDLDGDGQSEIVFASRTKLSVLKFKNNRFHVVDTTSLGNRYKLNAVNLADLNNDGRKEIYVSGSDGFKSLSMVLSWGQESGTRVIQNRINWYVRPMDVPGEGQFLLGQKANNDEDNGFVETSLYKLEKDNSTGRYKRGASYNVPRGVNLFDFVKADISGDGAMETIAIDKLEKMLVYKQNNELLWVSEGDYGGSTNILGPDNTYTGNPNSDVMVGDDDTNSRKIFIYVPSRMIVADVDGDGQDEIIIARNKRDGYKIFTNSRSYSSANVSCLKWSDGVMDELWKTKTINGNIVDYSFGFTGKNSVDDKGVQANGARLYVSNIENAGFVGFSLAKKSKVSSFAMAIKQSVKK